MDIVLTRNNVRSVFTPGVGGILHMGQYWHGVLHFWEPRPDGSLAAVVRGRVVEGNVIPYVPNAVTIGPQRYVVLPDEDFRVLLDGSWSVQF